MDRKKKSMKGDRKKKPNCEREKEIFFYSKFKINFMNRKVE